MSAFFGNMLIALKTSISATTVTAVNNTTTASISVGVSGGRGTYTYLWVQSGVTCTITTATSASTTFTGSGTNGTTNVYCAIKDTITGNTMNTSICAITWIPPISVNITPSIAAGGVSPQTISVLSITGGSGTYTLGTWSRIAFVGGTGGTVTAVGNGTGSATASRGGTTNTSSTFRVVITDSLGFTGTSNSCVISWNIA